MAAYAYPGLAGRNPAWGPDAAPPPGTHTPYYGYYQPYGGSSQYYYPSYPTTATSTPYTLYTHPGAAPGSTYPRPAPNLNPTFPAANMTNSTGGVGCEPAYNYFFPAAHTKIHVFRTGATPPWDLPPNFALQFHAAHVPVNTTLGELLKGLGANNPNPKKNRVFEVHPGGSGKFYKGMSFSGDEEDDMKKTCKEVGWDESRDGLPGGKPVVYLYVTNG